MRCSLRSQNPLRNGFLLAGVLFLGTPLMPSESACAQEGALENSALTLAPQDAAFFSTSLNLRQSCEELAEGNFVRRLRAVPFIKRVEAELRQQWDNPQGQLQQAKMILESPNVVNLINLGLDMSSTEIFVYGGDDWCESIEGLMALQNEITGIANQGEEAIQAYVRDLTREDLANVRIPTTVIGFKLTDDAIAREQLDALEGIIRFGLGSVDELKPLVAKMKRTDFKNGQTLSLSLDSSMIPEVEIPEEQREMFDKMLELLEGRRISFALGVKDNILLMTFGEDAAIIEQVGENVDSLLGHESLNVLKKQTPDNLRSVAYASKRFRESQWDANFSHYFERVASQFTTALSSQAENVPDYEQWQAEITADAKWMDSKLSELAPKFGPALSWSYATDAGTEGYAYDWTQNLAIENASPLSILEHAGDDTLVTIAIKQREVPGVESMLEYALDRVPTHLRRFIELVEDDADDRQKALMVLDRAWPLAQDIFAIARDKIGPALADNESVFSIASNWTTENIGPGLPPSAVPLPLPEMAIACKVRDRELFIQGCSEIYDVLDRVVELVREMEPNSVPPNYTVPRPDEEALSGGTRYFYSVLSNQVPLEGFEPQLLVGDDVMVMGYSMRQVDDMSAAESAPILPSWVESNTPIAAVSRVDFAGMVEAIRPWAVYGFSVSGIGMDTPLSDENGPVPTPNDLLQIWDTLSELGEAYASVTVADDGSTVTRWAWVSSQ